MKRKEKAPFMTIEKRDRAFISVHINLTPEQWNFLLTKPNASEFIRGLIDQAMVTKVETEVEAKPVERVFSPVEEEIIEELINEMEGGADRSEEWERENRPERIGFQKPHRYRTANFTLTWIHRAGLSSGVQQFLGEPVNEQIGVKMERAKELQYLCDEAEKRWTSNYPEHLKKQITDEYTLGELMEELGSQAQPISLQRVASILGKDYMWVYNKVRPLLAQQGYSFSREKS